MDTAAVVALLGITAAISWGVSDFFAAKSAKSIGPILAANLVNISGAVIFLIIYVLFLRSNVTITQAGFLYAAVGGTIFSVGASAFFVGLDAGPVSIVSPLTSMYPLATTALALLVFQAQLMSREIVGIILTILGIMAASGLLTLEKSKRRITRGPAFALIAALTWGIGFALFAQAVKRLGWQTALLIDSVFVSTAMLALTPFIKGKEVITLYSIKDGLRNKFVLSASIIQLVGVLTLSVGISRSTATGGAIVTAISACYPILTIFLALKHFHEKVRLIPLTGAFVGVIGVIVLALG